MDVADISPTKSLKLYMEKGEKWGRRCGLAEMKALTGEERNELGKLAIVALEQGWE